MKKAMHPFAARMQAAKAAKSKGAVMTEPMPKMAMPKPKAGKGKPNPWGKGTC